MDHRQARWNEAIRNLERAVELDPRDLENLLVAGYNYDGLHRYGDARRMYERAVAVAPHDYSVRIARAWLPLSEKADIRPLRAEIDAILREEPQAAPKIAEALFTCGIYDRDRSVTDRVLFAAMPAEGIPLGVTSFVRPREWYVGYAARTFGDAEGARIAFKAARAKVEEIIREQPDYAEAWTLLERIDAALGCKEEAIREGKRGCELLPMSSDTWEGPKQVRDLAEIYAWIGEKDLAFEYLQRAGRIPGPDYGS
jgi:tetratricopeptide (TPR) repeat protein